MYESTQTVMELEVLARESIIALLARCENNGDCSTCSLHMSQAAKCRSCRNDRQTAELLQVMLDKLVYHPLISLDEIAAMRYEDDIYIEYLDTGMGRWERFCSIVDTKYHGRLLTLIGAAALPLDKYSISWLPYRQKPGRKQD